MCYLSELFLCEFTRLHCLVTVVQRFTTTSRQTDTYRQTDRQTDIQTDRWTKTHSQKQTDRHNDTRSKHIHRDHSPGLFSALPKIVKEVFSLSLRHYGVSRQSPRCMLGTSLEHQDLYRTRRTEQTVIPSRCTQWTHSCLVCHGRVIESRVDRVWWLEPPVPYRIQSAIVLPRPNHSDKVTSHNYYNYCYLYLCQIMFNSIFPVLVLGSDTKVLGFTAAKQFENT